MSKFFDFCAANYPNPETTLAAFFPEMVDAAAAVGAQLADMPDLDGRRHYLPTIAGRKDQKQFYLASIERDQDGTIWPAITFKSFKGGFQYFKPRDLAWQRFEASRGAAMVNDNARQNYRAAADAAMAAAAASAAEQERQQTEGREAAAAAAVAAWEAAEPCNAHPYLERKGVSAYGLRMATTSMRAKLWNSDQAKWQTVATVAAGDLLVPMVDAAGNLVNLQRIDDAGEKRFLMGGRKQGTFHRIDGTAPALLAEGYATGATVRAATGAAVIVAFDAGNLRHVAAALSATGLHAVAADNDANDAGRKGAEATGLAFIMPPTVGDDWNDHAARHGLDAVAALLAPATKPAPATAPTAPAAILSDADKGIAELNQVHALTLMGGQVVVLHETVGERNGHELQFLTMAAFKAWYLPRTVPVEGKDRQGNPVIKHAQLADLWLKSPKRRQYEGVTFAPANNAPATHYNLWRGFAYEPLDCGMAAAAMKCRRLLSHMKYTLCNGNREHFRHLLAWAADMVQQPDRKKGVALVLRGAKGTGKSTFAEALAALLGNHAMKVTHMRHLTGNFNRHLADKLLVVAEESFWAGDKSDEGPLKDMITSERMTIEAKGVDAVEMPSLCRVMMITNNEWAVPASNDERRYFVLDVSDKRRQAFHYFSAIHAQLEGNGNEGLRALLTVLKKFPLQSVNLRMAPETHALRAQRAFSLEPHDQFVFDALSDHDLIGQEWDYSITVGKDEVYDAYIEASRKRGKLHLLSKEQFAKKLIRATGAKAARLRDGLARRQVYMVPAWDEAVNQFQKACGVDVPRLANDENEPF